MRTFKHEPLFIVGGGGGSLFVVLYGNLIVSTKLTPSAKIEGKAL